MTTFATIQRDFMAGHVFVYDKKKGRKERGKEGLL